jgi:hypothetical protein
MSTVWNPHLLGSLGPVAVSCGRFLQAVADVLGRDVCIGRRLEGTSGFTFIVPGEPPQFTLMKLKTRLGEVLGKLSPIDRDLMLGFILYSAGFQELACAPGPLKPRYLHAMGYDTRDGFNEIASAPGPGLTPRYGHSLGYDTGAATEFGCLPIGGAAMMSGPGPGAVFGPQ